ncbi:MAG TPA: hypothetical protein VFZ21_12055 [Gemmatimonadaceae bacterium]|nr:hypothetical protein [Gemmatimonadaceae bacterium]
MTEPRTDRTDFGDHRSANDPAARPAEEPQYPTNHVLGVVDTPEHAKAALATLESSGFSDRDIGLSCGPAAADALGATTGRKGLANVAIRIAERLNIRDDEMMLKDRYEDALRDGRIVLSVPTPTEDEKEKAADALRQHGGHLISYLKRFSFEMLEP